MNIDEEIRKIEETKAGIIRFAAELDDKLARKEMNGIEYHLLMSEKLCGKTKQELMGYLDSKIIELKGKMQAEEDSHKKKHMITISAAAIIMITLAIIGIIFTNPEALTGYAVLTPHTEMTDQALVFGQSGEVQLNMSNMTSLSISGVLEGIGATVKLRTESAEYIVGEIVNTAKKTVSTEYSLKTDKTIYYLGEAVLINITPPMDETSLYIIFGEDTNIIGSANYTPNQTGEYKVRALITVPNDIIRLETAFSVIEPAGQANITNDTNETANEAVNETEIEQGDNTVTYAVSEETNETNATYTFNDVCAGSCIIPDTSNPTLVVELAEGSTLIITGIKTTLLKENQAPAQVTPIPDINLVIGENKTINLSGYFTDPDNDPIQYDVNNLPEVDASLLGDIMTLSSEQAGEYMAYVYATDGNELVTSNTFQLIVTESAIEMNTTANETGNETAPETNETGNWTFNQTWYEMMNMTLNITNGTVDCSAPNPNDRPLECLQQESTDFFPEQEIMLSNLDREPAGRFTPIGNLLIKGEVIAQSTSTPGDRDYKIGYVDIDGFSIATIWIDSATGDLHLRGSLYEENTNLEPPEGSFSIINKRSIFLAYADQITGDMHIRGNVIPYRQNLLKIK